MHTLLFVDDEEDIVNSLHRTFRKGYRVIKCSSGEEAIKALDANPIDLIISDQRMPGMTGDQVLSYAKEHHPKTIRILLTGYTDMESLINSVNQAQIYKYLSKPWEPEMLRLTVVRALESLDLDRQLAKAYLNTITMLGMACEGKDENTANHVRRVQHYTQSLAETLGLPKEEAQQLGVMSILHDVGKMYIPDHILKKPGKLDTEEWALMQQHASFGVKILGDDPYFEKAREIAGGHHENYDGTGYPQGLKGEETPLSARIVKIADTFDALTTVRPYKKAWTIEETLAWIQENSGTQFDAKITEALLQLNTNGKLAEIMQKFVDEAPPNA